MIGLLLFPILVCGYLFITTWPSERIKLSLYHGWSLYIRAAAIGTIVIPVLYIFFGILFPWAGRLAGSHFDFHLFQDTNIYRLASSWIENSKIIYLAEPTNTKQFIDIATLSIVSIFLSWVIKWFALPILSNKNKIFRLVSKLLFLSKCKEKSIEKLFKEKAPIEYLLYIISKQSSSDIEYNKDIEEIRNEVAGIIKSGQIDRREHQEELSRTLGLLEYRTVNHALITLENRKFYIGLPLIIPEPDEDSVLASSVQIIPVMSGIRKEKDQSLEITTKYDFDLSSPKHEDSISIPTGKIISVSGFMFETHERLNKSKKKTIRKTRFTKYKTGLKHKQGRNYS